MSEFARLLHQTIEEHGAQYIERLRAARSDSKFRAQWGADNIDYGRGPFHVLERMTSIPEGTLRAASRPLCNLDIETITHLLGADPAPLLAAARDERTAEHRIADAANIIGRFATIDGAHHKQWCFDQALRAMLRPEQYDAWVAEKNSDPEYDPWSEGIAP